MDRKGFEAFYAANVGLIHAVTHKGHNRLQAIGAGMDYDDLFQEFVVKFIQCYDLFDEEQGKFSTYFTRAALNRLNHLAEKFEVERIELRMKSVEEIGDLCNDDPDEDSPQNRVVCGNATPEQIVMGNDIVDSLMGELSPLAAMITRMAIDPPDFMEREFEANQAHDEYARSCGAEFRNRRNTLNLSFVCHVLQKTTKLSSSALRRAQTEVMSVAKGTLK